MEQGGEHPDVDILVSHYARACAILTSKACTPRDVKLQAVVVADVYFDLRTTGDQYYPDGWTKQMLSRRVRGRDGLYHLNDEDQYYAIPYRAVVHKGHIGSGYLHEVTALMPNECDLDTNIVTWLTCLQRWMEPRFVFSATCHNCGGQYLEQVGLPNCCVATCAPKFGVDMCCYECPAPKSTPSQNPLTSQLDAPNPAVSRGPTTFRTRGIAPTSRQEAEPCAQLADIWGSVKCSRWVKVRDQLYLRC